MQKSTIPFLLTSFIAAVFLVSCSSVNLVQDYKIAAIEKPIFQNTYFSNPEIDYVYKANITVYGNELTGIFIAKKINETTHRVVFTTEFGNKLLDFEISDTDFKINSIVEELDRKILINTLKNDFKLLLRKDFLVTEQLKKSTDEVYKSKDGKYFNYLFVSTMDRKLYKIAQASKTKEKINMSFTSENNIFADNIIIQHYNLKLRIELNYFKQN